MAYLRNCWYMAGWADEIEDGQLARMLLDEPVVLFRDEEGKAAALLDRCPHRFAPLSLGSIREGAIECRYHGLRFNGAGACVHNPHGPIVNTLRVRRFPVEEAYRAIWIWMGDPDLADRAKLRDLSFMDDAPGTAFSKGYVVGRGNYQLFTDNILDLTHADYLHPDTLGGGTFTRTRAKIYQNGGMISVHWHAFDDTPSPMMASRVGNAETVDSWTEVDWTAPAIMTLRSGATPVGRSRDEGGSSFNLHVLTPQTATSSHYFYAATRDYALDDAAVNERIAKMRDLIFATEDEPMIAAQQERMGNSEFWNLRPALLRSDEAAVRVRRALDELIAREQAAAVDGVAERNASRVGT